MVEVGLKKSCGNLSYLLFMFQVETGVPPIEKDALLTGHDIFVYICLTL